MRLSTTLFYAAKGNGSQVSRTRQTGLKQGLGLAHFVERGRTLSLWRDSLRTIRILPKGETRDELIAHARMEFERNRNTTDLERIRYLISTGRDELRNTESTLRLALSR